MYGHRNLKIQGNVIYSHASLNDGDTFWEMRRLAISSFYEHHDVLTQT
jgi:hypothetical protein